MTDGATLFSRFAYPPNSLGYCGPADTALLAELIAAGGDGAAEHRKAIAGFAGAWPYLELIGRCSGKDPLNARVVEAYWLGNRLLDSIDTLTWGNSLDDRFRARAGEDWDRIVAGVQSGGVPNHAFHVFCAYPWVGLLRSGAVEQALIVLDRCRIRWGTVLDDLEGKFLVSSRTLEWDGESLSLGPPQAEVVAGSVDPTVQLQAGDTVALHWDFVCQRLSGDQAARLRRQHAWHLAIANGHGSRLAVPLEA